jgi:hypothetical protein
VSYLGRVARRAAGARGPSGLTPTGASGSPLARYDQRLNLPGAGGLPGVGRAWRDGDGGPGAAGADDLGLDDGTTRSSTGAPPAGPFAGSEIARVAPPSDRTSPGRAPAHRQGARQRDDEPNPSARRPDAAASADAQRARRDAEPGSVPDAGSRPPRQGRAARTRQAPDAGAVEEDGTPATRRPSPITPGDPLAAALAKVQRWMAKPPREGAPAGRDGRDGRDGRPGPDRSAGPAGDARQAEGAAGARGVRARMAAIDRALSAAPAAPQLRIGRIDVQVVTPPPPAPAPSPVARPGRARPAAAAPSDSTPASYLTFGLRQT